MNLLQILKESINTIYVNYIGNDEIEKMIREKVNEFNRELLFKKEEYIAELMKHIRIYSEQNIIDKIPRYVITVENTYKIEN